MPMPVKVTTLQDCHISEAVRLHLLAFPGFFLSFLGAVFLRELYRAFLRDETAIALVAVRECDGELVGFVVGTTAPDGFFARLLKRRWWAFCLASARAVAVKPWIAPRLARALVYRGDEPEEGGGALLSSIAVDPASQGSGVGVRLVRAWEAEARSRGAKSAYLTTDELENEHAVRFYEKCGWRRDSRFVTKEGRKMLRYVIRFS